TRLQGDWSSDVCSSVLTFSKSMVMAAAFCCAICSDNAAEKGGDGNPSTGKDNTPPPGFTALFNGTDLSGWKGLLASPYDNPIKQIGRASCRESVKMSVE